MDSEKKTIDQLLSDLMSTKDGLDSAEANDRLSKYGPNETEEKRKSLILQFLSYFWSTIPWMIEFSAILSLVLQHYSNFTRILILLGINGLVGPFKNIRREVQLKL